MRKMRKRMFGFIRRNGGVMYVIIASLVFVVLITTLYLTITSFTRKSSDSFRYSNSEPSVWLNTPVSSETSTPVQDQNNWQKYVDSIFGISFEYPITWDIRESIYPTDNYRALEISNESLGQILVTKEDNPEHLSPRQWFAKNRHKYHPNLIVEIADTQVRGNQTLVIGQPDTCQTVPMITAMIGHNNAIFVITQYERGSRPIALELGKLLETISFGDKQDTPTSIPPSYLQYPPPPTNVSCPD